MLARAQAVAPCAGGGWAQAFYAQRLRHPQGPGGPGWSSGMRPQRSLWGPEWSGTGRISLWAEEIWEGHGEVAGLRGLGDSQSHVSPSLSLPLGHPTGKSMQAGSAQALAVRNEPPEGEVCPSPASSRSLIPITCLTPPRPVTGCPTPARVASGAA